LIIPIHCCNFFETVGILLLPSHCGTGTIALSPKAPFFAFVSLVPEVILMIWTISSSARRFGVGVLFASLGLGVIYAEAPADKAESKAKEAAADPTTLDQKIIADVKANSQVAKNLQHLCDVIGPRLTGSANLEKANKWAAEKMKEYGLTNVQLEPWEIPVAWERGTATLTMIEPNAGKQIPVAASAWTPGTKGKIAGEIVFVDARTKDDLAKYKGKLKDAIILSRAPSSVAPVTDLSYLGNRPAAATPATAKEEPKKAEPKKEEPKKDDPKKEEVKKDEPCGNTDDPKKEEPKKEEAKKDEPKKEEAKKDEPKKEDPPAGRGTFGPEFMAFRRELAAFIRAEGAVALLSDSAKPHGLIVTGGSWPTEDRGGRPAEPMPSLSLAHEQYAMLYRLATAKDGPKPKVEVEITNKFIPGPITVYNTVGEILGSEKPDEFVVIGAHLDSWDLGTGATDNGTGSCTVLEVARTLGALAKAGIKPKRTIRFVLFTGEEQGLYGSKEYVKRHKDEMPKTSAALVHDTGTGKVIGLAMQGRAKVKELLESELASLKDVDGWKGLNIRNQGGTDHLSFDTVGVPGFACDQDMDEYRLTHHTQTDTFDHVKMPNIVQGSQVMAVAVMRIANLPELLPRERPARGARTGPMPMEEPKKEEKKDDKKGVDKKGGDK
jgi:carboxypeptidase Q